ncbi:protein TASOR 2 [Erpetoichthys calabaricus]|nr:protein TASOR 2 [Erpetoichthys calabaricus]
MENEKSDSTSSTDLYIKVSLESTVFTEKILPILHRSYMNPESENVFTYDETYLVQNQKLLEKYNSNRAEKQQKGYSDEELKESFGFILCKNETQAKILCETGLKVGNGSFSTLGDLNKGVYVSKYSDCLQPEPWCHGKSGYIVIFRLVKGKVKAVTENYTNNLTQPVSGYDCHVSENIDTVCSRTSSFQAFECTQYYVYEFQDGKTMMIPSQICPYAVVHFLYTESTLSMTSVKEQISNEVQRGFNLWTGQLTLKDNSVVYPVTLKSLKGAFFPTKLAAEIIISNVIRICDLKTILPQAVFDKESYTADEVCISEVYCSLYEVVTSKNKGCKLHVLSQELKNKDLALVSSLNDNGILVLLTSSALNAYKEQKYEKDLMLYAIFIFPASRAIQKDLNSSCFLQNSGSEICPNVNQILPALKYALRKSAEYCHHQGSSLCESLEYHLQNYMAVTEEPLSSACIKENFFAEQCDISPVQDQLYKSVKCPEVAISHLESYFRDPHGYHFPVSKVSDLCQQISSDNKNDCTNSFFSHVKSSETTGNAEYSINVHKWTLRKEVDIHNGSFNTVQDIQPPNIKQNLNVCTNAGKITEEMLSSECNRIQQNMVDPSDDIVLNQDEEVDFGMDLTERCNSAEDCSNLLVPTVPHAAASSVPLRKSVKGCSLQNEKSMAAVDGSLSASLRSNKIIKKRYQKSNRNVEKNLENTAVGEPHSSVSVTELCQPKKKVKNDCFKLKLKEITTKCGKVFVPHGSKLFENNSNSLKQTKEIENDSNLNLKQQKSIIASEILPRTGDILLDPDIAQRSANDDVEKESGTSEADLRGHGHYQEPKELKSYQRFNGAILNESCCGKRKRPPIHAKHKAPVIDGKLNTLQRKAKHKMKMQSSNITLQCENTILPHNANILNNSKDAARLSKKQMEVQSKSSERKRRAGAAHPNSQSAIGLNSGTEEITDSLYSRDCDINTHLKKQKVVKTTKGSVNNKNRKVEYIKEKGLGLSKKSHDPRKLDYRQPLSRKSASKSDTTVDEGGGVCHSSDALNLLADLALSSSSRSTNNAENLQKNTLPCDCQLKYSKDSYESSLTSEEMNSSTKNCVEESGKNERPLTLYLEDGHHETLLPSPVDIWKEHCYSLPPQMPALISSGITELPQQNTESSCEHDLDGGLTCQEDVSFSQSTKEKNFSGKFCQSRIFFKENGTYKVKREWNEAYDFALDSKYTNETLDKTVCRALHGSWDLNIEETHEQIHLILHVWIGLFYSRPTMRFFQADFKLDEPGLAETAIQRSSLKNFNHENEIAQESLSVIQKAVQETTDKPINLNASQNEDVSHSDEDQGNIDFNIPKAKNLSPVTNGMDLSEASYKNRSMEVLERSESEVQHINCNIKLIEADVSANVACSVSVNASQNEDVSQMSDKTDKTEYGADYGNVKNFNNNLETFEMNHNKDKKYVFFSDAANSCQSRRKLQMKSKTHTETVHEEEIQNGQDQNATMTLVQSGKLNGELLYTSNSADPLLHKMNNQSFINYVSEANKEDNFTECGQEAENTSDILTLNNPQDTIPHNMRDNIFIEKNDRQTNLGDVLSNLEPKATSLCSIGDSEGPSCSGLHKLCNKHNCSDAESDIPKMDGLCSYIHNISLPSPSNESCQKGESLVVEDKNINAVDCVSQNKSVSNSPTKPVEIAYKDALIVSSSEEQQESASLMSFQSKLHPTENKEITNMEELDNAIGNTAFYEHSDSFNQPENDVNVEKVNSFESNRKERRNSSPQSLTKSRKTDFKHYMQHTPSNKSMQERENYISNMDSLVPVTDCWGNKKCYTNFSVVKDRQNAGADIKLQRDSWPFAKYFEYIKDQNVYNSKHSLTQEALNMEYLHFSDCLKRILKTSKDCVLSKRSLYGNKTSFLRRSSWRKCTTSFSDTSSGLDDASNNSSATYLSPSQTLQITVNVSRKSEIDENNKSIKSFNSQEFPLKKHPIDEDIKGGRREFCNMDTERMDSHSPFIKKLGPGIKLHEPVFYLYPPRQHNYVKFKNSSKGYPGSLKKIIDSLCNSLHHNFNNVLNESLKNNLRFFILETKMDVFFENMKEVLKNAGLYEIQIDFFDQLDQCLLFPIIIIIRNEDISTYVHTIPHLLKLKKTPNVSFSGVDSVDDVLNFNSQELFIRGGFLVCDGELFRSLRLEHLKEIFYILDELNKKEKWKWLFHYRDQKILKENGRKNSTDHAKKYFMDFCQEAGIVDVLPYHDCDLVSQDRPMYLECMQRLQVQYIASRLAVFLTDTPDECFEKSGILTLDKNTFFAQFKKK